MPPHPALDPWAYRVFPSAIEHEPNITRYRARLQSLIVDESCRGAEFSGGLVLRAQHGLGFYFAGVYELEPTPPAYTLDALAERVHAETLRFR